MAREYLVWRENGDLISGPHRSREVADARAQKAREECAADKNGGCGNGDPESSDDPAGTTCGVMDPHGISVQVKEDGRDITGHDY